MSHVEPSQSSQNADYSTWLTKQQAADAIGVSTKTVEQLAQDGQIQQAVWRPGGRGARRAVYHPDDVARIATARRPGVAPFVLPAEQARNGHGRDATALAPPQQGPREDRRQVPPSWLVDLAAFMRRVAAERPTSEKSEKAAPTLWVTVAEASAITGLSQAWLRRRIADGALSAIRDRGWRIRRTDLEAL